MPMQGIRLPQCMDADSAKTGHSAKPVPTRTLQSLAQEQTLPADIQATCAVVTFCFPGHLPGLPYGTLTGVTNILSLVTNTG